MTLPSDPNPISFAQLAAEYDAPSTNISLGNFYYNGTYLAANTCTNAVRSYEHDTAGFTAHFKDIPTHPPSAGSNPISMSAFRGKSYYYARQETITKSGNNQSVQTSDIEAESPKSGNAYSAYFVVETNGNCTATSTSNKGLTITDADRDYTSCYLKNANKIYGKGGNGGKGQQGGTNATPGGVALLIRPNAYINNQDGRILGGGGGGGGSASKRFTYKEGYCSTSNTNYSIGGCGGGGGAGGGSGGGAGAAQPSNFMNSGFAGSAGNYNNTSANGSGGSGCGFNRVLGTVCANPGGNGGDWGAAGENKSTNGGAGGKSIQYSSGKILELVLEGTIAGDTQALT